MRSKSVISALRSGGLRVQGQAGETVRRAKMLVGQPGDLGSNPRICGGKERTTPKKLSFPLLGVEVQAFNPDT